MIVDSSIRTTGVHQRHLYVSWPGRNVSRSSLHARIDFSGQPGTEFRIGDDGWSEDFVKLYHTLLDGR